MDNVFEAIRKAAVVWPDKEILLELPAGGGADREITYSELIVRADRVAGFLRGTGCEKGSRVLLVYGSNIEFVVAFLGCIFSGVIAVPMYLTKSASFADELRAYSGDCQTNIVLTTSDMQPMLQARLPGYSIHATDGDVPGGIPAYPVRLSMNSEAFILYTSGSTSKPKGVVHTHQSFSNHVYSVQERLYLQDTDSSVCVSPLQHIMGMLNVFISLTFGLKVVFLPIIRVMQSPLDWVLEVSRHKATVFLGPDFVYKMAAAAYSKDKAGDLDLGHLRIALSGSERILPSTVESFNRVFSNHGLRSSSLTFGYGMTEAGIISISDLDGDPRVLDTNPGIYDCGQQISSYRAIITDKDTGYECAPGTAGEIWVSGPGLASGYWNNPEETERSFNVFMQNGDGPYFKTGDLGFRVDGNLFITGRVKELIIIKGQNYYPEDIELGVKRQAEAANTGQCVAFSVNDSEGERLILAVETGLEDQEELSRLARRIAEDIHARNGIRIANFVYVPLQSLPVTRTGKLRRSECKSLYHQNLLTVICEFVNPGGEGTGISSSGDSWNWAAALTPAEIEEVVLADLVAAFKKLLPEESGNIDINQPIHLLGTDSITAFELHNLIEVKYGVNLPITFFLEGKSIREIASQILDERKGAQSSPAIDVTKQELEHGNLDIEAIYNNLDNYSEEELDRILSVLNT